MPTLEPFDTVCLESQLRSLHLGAILQGYGPGAQEAAAQEWSYIHYLAHLVDQESRRRTRNRLQRRIQEARFPLLKELADFDFAAIPSLKRQLVLELAQGHYLERAESILLVGNPGLGKSHMAIGLGLAACRQDQRVRFYTVTHLVNVLQEAQANHQLPAFVEKALRHQLIILDEFGYVPFSPTGAQLLFQFCSALHERTSLLLTTNLPFSQWVQVLGDERLTTALLDRLTFQSHILEFRGDSYRLRQSITQRDREQEG